MPDLPPSLLELAALCMCDDFPSLHIHDIDGGLLPGWTALSQSDDDRVGVAGTDDEVTADPPSPLFRDAERPYGTRTVGRERRRWRDATHPIGTSTGQGDRQ